MITHMVMYTTVHSPERALSWQAKCLPPLTLQLTLHLPLGWLFSSLNIIFSSHGIVMRMK